MFSARLPLDRGESPLSQKLAALRAAGAPLLDLTESNPTRAGLAYPGDEVLAALANPAALVYEPDPRGILPAREAVAAYYANSHGARVDPDRVLLTASTSEAYAFLFKLLCDPGDRVLVPHPGYPLFDLLAALEGVALDSYPLGYDGAWHLDVDAVARALTPCTRAVLLVSPNNPTGSFLKRRELDALLELCRARDLALVCDEVFADYAYGPDPERVPTVAGESGALCFALGGLSKVCALPQMKLAWLACAGPEEAREQARARLELIADSYLSVGAPAQHAAARLLAGRGPVQARIMERVRDNRAFALDALSRDAGGACTALHAEGGWYLVLRVPATRGEDEWMLALAERYGVLAQPGYFFDFAREAYLVLSLIAPGGEFRAGFERVLACVRELA